MPIVLPVGRIILTTTVNSSFGQSQAVSSLYVKLKIVACRLHFEQTGVSIVNLLI